VTDQYSKAGNISIAFFKGAKPANFRVQAPTKFRLVINLKTAKALGLDVPVHLQQLANEIIE
jgi:putative ABC transport system substrate-binding protein